MANTFLRVTLMRILRGIWQSLFEPLAGIRGLLYALRFKPHRSWSVGKLLERQARRYPHRPAVRFGTEEWTYAELNARANQIAALLESRGVKSGDVVALLMETRPEILACTAGALKLGAVVGMLNYNQRDAVLGHSIGLIKPKVMIVSAECVTALETTRYMPGHDASFEYYWLPAGGLPRPAGFADLNEATRDLPDRNPATTGSVKMSQPAFYIFTSGTTGMPKASVMTHYRWLMGMAGVGQLAMHIRADDVLYVSLPFYHNNALTVSWGSAMGAGACMALSRKFSASRFWDEIRQYRATAFCYVGDVCRYLLNQPPSPRDRDHAVRVVAGNGLGPDIWEEFKRRFGIERVAEFYGASECNLAFINYLNVDRTAGMCPLPFAIVAYDPERGEPVRDAKGRLRRVPRGEAGLFLAQVNRLAPFEGYTDREASEKKLLRNAFKKGDCWFNTGDLVRGQGFRHIQFVDRLGDTFRWKGENVATTEVEAILNDADQVEQAVVYGVKVPNADGRAGMAALTLRVPLEQFASDRLAATLRQRLPAYAMPLFLRIRAEHDVTGTFKSRKVDLKDEGFDVEKVRDPIFFYAGPEHGYRPLDAAAFAEIHSGAQRV